MMEELRNELHSRILSHLSKLEAYSIKKGRTREEVGQEFEQDPLYSIFGLDTPEYVGAILAGGTVTSIHRKIGDLYEDCIRAIFRQKIGLPHDLPRYSTLISSGDTQEHRTIDAHIPFDQVSDGVRECLSQVAEREVHAITHTPRVQVVGMGFEVRHCYQSADSKRIQADEAMARHLLLSGYLPVMLIFCNQSNRGIIQRYTGTWLVKEGRAAYEYLRDITGFDFYQFLLMHKDEYREIVRKALQRTID